MESIYNNWDDAAEATLRRMVVVASNSPRDRNMFDPIEKYLSQWIIRLQGGDFHESDVDLAVDILFRAGVTSLQEMTQHQSFSESDMLDLLVRKQHDYGHDNINNFGIIGVAIRMCDKIARIKNLSNRDNRRFERAVARLVLRYRGLCCNRKHVSRWFIPTTTRKRYQMSGYGKEGTEYTIAGETLAVNQEFLMATTMATIIVLKEITGKEDIDIIIEQVAEQLYDRFTKAEHGTTEERTDPAGE